MVLSNGPGDPEPLTGIIAAVRDLVGSRMPVLGICLGHQLLGLALGGETFKLKFGHHGGNQPVREIAGGQGARSPARTTASRCDAGFAARRLHGGARSTSTTARSKAFAVAGKPVFSVQYHPEAAPGPHDASALFDRFLAAVATVRG